MVSLQCIIENEDVKLQLTMRLFSPRALLVHILRFDADNQKNKAKIHVKESLSLASLHMADPDDDAADDDEDHVNCYHLCGVINHVGENVNSGHYTAITKREEQWVFYDDTVVTRRSISHFTGNKYKQMQGYMALYRR
jgi:ubiquitin C-terminal hydrolase